MEVHFGHSVALLIALGVAILFTYIPFLVTRYITKSPTAGKYLSREWIIIAFLSAIVSYVILRDGMMMDKPIISTIFWTFCIIVGLFQAGRFFEKGMSIRLKKGDAEIEIDRDK
jgi:FtsH-binding integral membrane protein